MSLRRGVGTRSSLIDVRPNRYCAVTGTDTPFPRLKDFPSPEASSEVFYDFALDFTL